MERYDQHRNIYKLLGIKNTCSIFESFSAIKDLKHENEEGSGLRNSASSLATSFFKAFTSLLSETTCIKKAQIHATNTSRNPLVILLIMKRMRLQFVTCHTMFTWALFVTSFALVANESVFLVCSTWLKAGLMVHIIAVRAFPPSEDCNIRVSFESL